MVAYRAMFFLTQSYCTIILRIFQDIFHQFFIIYINAHAFCTILTALIMLITMTACSSSGKEDTSQTTASTEITEEKPVYDPNAGCTIFIYMCGSNLDSKQGLAGKDIDELLSADIPENVNVVIETGGSKKWRSHGISNDKIQRYIVKDHELVLVDEQENKSMGSSESLLEWIRWAAENYPGERNILVISRNNFFAAVCLMTIAKVEGQENVMLNWVFHDRTDKVKQSAHGCLFRNIPIGVKIRENEGTKELMNEIVTRSNESIANSCCEWSILSDSVFKNDMLLMIYETADIMSSGKLTTLGAVNEQVNDHRDAPMRSVAVQILDLPQGIMVNLGLASSLFSAEKTEHIKQTMEGIIQNMIGADLTS